MSMTMSMWNAALPLVGLLQATFDGRLAFGVLLALAGVALGAVALSALRARRRSSPGGPRIDLRRAPSSRRAA